MNYTYPFICFNLDKYEELIREARTIEERRFRIGQYDMYNLKYKQYKN